VRGFVCYGQESWNGARRHTYEVTQELLRAQRPLVARMVTGSHALSDYRAALGSLRRRRTSGAIKVVLRPGT
jgi:threonine dehydrogenase-like Zn-dependent dehydrogenase